jgi:asparagine synthase (glutamine-hydrolysing)
MCGIFAHIQDSTITEKQKEIITKEFYKSQNRGPDNSQFVVLDNVFLGFHRLSINGIEHGNQPMTLPGDKDVILVCNGEIYNYKQLGEQFHYTLTTGSDCEIILHLYNEFGYNKMVELLDGVFGFVIYDKTKHMLYAGRDPIGVRSLFMGTTPTSFTISSEMKSLHDLSDTINQFPVGNVWDLDTTNFELNTFTKYYNMDTIYNDTSLTTSNPAIIMDSIYTLLNNAVTKRLMSDKPIGCLLSGGFDSSIVAALLSKHFPPNTLKTFSIGLKGSPDLLYARKVADFIHSDHHEVVVSEEEMLGAIEEDITQIESYDTTTVRASTPMYLLSKYIKQHTDVTVVYSGEGSDEASGSYLYFHNAPSPEAFKKETIRLMKDLSYYDVLRCDKSIAGAGLEVRVPFLDKDFLAMYMNVSPEQKMPATYKMEKYLLRKAFEKYNLLPKEVLWRMKEGMSDGVSSQSRGWYEIIQEHAETLFSDKQLITARFTYSVNSPMSKEALWFRELFNKYYHKAHHTIPYYWLPKWSGDLVEPSARALAGVYKTNTPTTTNTNITLPNDITTKESSVGNTYFKIK